MDNVSHIKKICLVNFCFSSFLALYTAHVPSKLNSRELETENLYCYRQLNLIFLVDVR
jgi:hypothetical protein